MNAQSNIKVGGYNAGWMQGWYNNGRPPAESIDFISTVVPANKIAIETDFYGYIWKGGTGTDTEGVNEPRRQSNNSLELIPTVPYFQIMEEYFPPHLYLWDSSASALYLNIDTLFDWDDMFINYVNERTWKEKIEYVKKKRMPEYLSGNLSPECSRILVNSP